MVRAFEGPVPEFDLADVARAAEFYAEWGFVVVRALTDAQCAELIREQWNQVILKQPWSDPIKVFGPGGKLLRPDDPGFLEVVTAPLSVKQRREFSDKWTFHRGFGACCDDAVFHLPGVCAIREDPKLYALAARVMGNQELWVGINRSIQKLPGEGEDEFIHVDANPLFPDRERASQMCGKVLYTPARVVLVPGTHTDAFRAEFKSKYEKHYPAISAKAAKFAIGRDKPDPLGIVEKAVQIPIRAGCAVFWHEWLFHGMAKTPLNEPTEYGTYLGYFESGSRAGYVGKCGVVEREDRVASYTLGRAPKLWPSLDRIHFVPYRFTNFPKILEGYVRKMPPGHPSIVRGARVTLKPWPVDGYAPATLSPLGQKLLGISSEEYAEAHGRKRKRAGSAVLVID